MNRDELVRLFVEKLKIAQKKAETKASAIFELNDAMKDKEVTFSYIKSDGTTRIARGTMRTERLPEFKGTGRPTNFDLQLYFDLDKQSFR
jgi:hypothetical protein